MSEPPLLAQLPPLAARLLRAANELSFARALDTVTGIVQAAARDLTEADGISFILRDGDLAHYLDQEALAPLWKGQRFPMQASVSGWVMEHGVPAVIPDISTEGRVPVDAYRSTFVKSLAMVPVRPPDSIAAIGVYWARPHRLGAAELNALQLLADSTALALANVNLYEESRSALDREHQARAVAERAMSAQNDFLAVVAHELRQPLHACLAALRLMGGSSDGHDSSARARAIVERQIQHMARLVDDLGNAAQVVRGDVALHRQPLAVSDLIARVEEAVRPLMAERSHQFIVHVADAPFVNADPARLVQVLLNLLSNAAKYTDPGGQVVLSVRSAGGRVQIDVTDNGRGIPLEQKPRIFDLFARAATDPGGFGIGLAVARRLIAMHDGTLDLASTGPGQGSTFVVTLPLETSVP